MPNKPTRLQEGGPSVSQPWCNYEHTDTGRNDLSPPGVHVYLVLNDPPLYSPAFSCGKILYNSCKELMELPFILCTQKSTWRFACRWKYIPVCIGIPFICLHSNSFPPKVFFVFASLNVLNHKALSYKFFEFPTTLPFCLTCILHCQMSTNSPKCWYF